jgi:hypothetical protein
MTHRVRVLRLHLLRRSHSSRPRTSPTRRRGATSVDTEDHTARALSDKRTQAAYDKYLHIGCYAFFDSCANAAVSEGLDTLSNGPPL